MTEKLSRKLSSNSLRYLSNFAFSNREMYTNLIIPVQQIQLRNFKWTSVIVRSWSGTRLLVFQEDSPRVVILWSSSLTTTDGSRSSRLSFICFSSTTVTSFPGLNRSEDKKYKELFNYNVYIVTLTTYSDCGIWKCSQMTS